MSLNEYKRKRHFGISPEPAPGVRRGREASALRFVVQKHRASRLHYDFRLEWNGVLLSWAVPKGPSVNPAIKRLAMAVEDHPLEYAAFEGVIPAGQYGGGTVMVWDRGTYVPDEPDVARSLRRGESKFTLAGQKLHGGWVLVRTGGADSRTWLLLKRRDAFARKTDILDAEPYSADSQRLLAEIAFDEGGDIERAASGDPEAALRKLMRDPETRARVPRSRPSVWHSTSRSVSRSG